MDIKFGVGSTWTFNISIVDIWKLIFKKKICKECSSILALQNGKRSYKGLKSDLDGDLTYGDHHEYSYIYRCPKCVKLIKLSEL
jgi:hypothetical protein